VPPYSFADPSVLAFVAIPAGLVAAFVVGVAVSWRRSGAAPAATRRAVVVASVGAAAWMAATALVARSGILREWDRMPPPFGILLVSILALAVVIALGPVGGRFAAHVPLWLLVGVQAFRLPLELAMHGMYEHGIMPIQMSYSGRNLDIVTGASALVVALLLARGWAGRRLAAVWNLAGLLLLANIVTIAVLSTPPFAYFGERQLNVWVTYPPFVWLPAVMVLVALAGHLVIARALVASTGSGVPS